MTSLRRKRIKLAKWRRKHPEKYRKWLERQPCPEWDCFLKMRQLERDLRRDFFQLLIDYNQGKVS